MSSKNPIPLLRSLANFIKLASLLVVIALIAFLCCKNTSDEIPVASAADEDLITVNINSNVPLQQWKAIGDQNADGSLIEGAAWSYVSSGNYIVNNANQNPISGYIHPNVNLSSFDLYTTIGSWNDDDDAMGIIFHNKHYGVNNFDSYMFLMGGPWGSDATWNNGTSFTSGLYKVKNSSLGSMVRLCTPNTANLKWTRGAYTQVHVKADKNHIQVWVNNKLEIDYTDTANTALTDGSIGFFSISQVDARFKDIRYTARLATYHVTPDPNGEGVTLSDTTPVAGIHTKTWKASLPSATRDGYVFKGWNTKPDGTGTDMTSSVVAGKPTNVVQDTTVYAQWVKLHHVRYVDSVTGEVIKEEYIENNKKTTPPTEAELPKHEWYDYKGFSYDPQQPITDDTDITVRYERNDMFDISVRINWKDAKDYDKIRPETASVTLYANDERVAEMDLGEDSGWAETINVAGHDADGEVISYRWEIAGNIDGYTCYEPDIEGQDKIASETWTNTAEIWTFPLEHIGMREIVVVKIWDDQGNFYKERPESVTFVVTSNQPVDDTRELMVDSTDADDADFNMWRNAIALPRWNANEEFIEYDVQEQEIIGYDLAQKAGNMDDGFVFTNKVWGHTTMPSAGGSDSEGQLILFSVSVLLLITGCIVVLRRTAKKID